MGNENQRTLVKRLVLLDEAMDLPIEQIGELRDLGGSERRAYIKDIQFFLLGTSPDAVEVYGIPRIEVEADKPYVLGDSLSSLILEKSGGLSGYLESFRNYVANQGEVYSLALLREMFKPAEDRLRYIQRQSNSKLK